MSSTKTDGPKNSLDSAVSVLGQDGGAATVNATVLYRLDPAKATTVFRNLGTKYAGQIVKPVARGCVRLIFTKYPIVNAATTSGNDVESDVAHCIKDRIVKQGILLSDFQLKQVTLDPTLQVAVGKKVAAQQLQQQQVFDLATAQKQADIKRIGALATADTAKIIQCGGHVTTVKVEGADSQVIIPNPPASCDDKLTQEFLQFSYIQALQAVATGSGSKTVVLPFDKNLTPLINVAGAGS
jgi:regulator of protease activity HflC (stomatin/prohibitin superfamily)